MRIAILGTAPSSMLLAPFGDESYRIWSCSPGTYPYLPRVDAFFELHRWEPGVVGKPMTQKTWFSPEYVQWLSMLKCPVWMSSKQTQIPESRALPVADLTGKYGTFFFTSSIAWMIACAIEDILEERAHCETHALPVPPSTIALFGVDMAANEEYGFQRAGCQHFLLLAADLGIEIVVPPESDLLRPSALYGIDESEPWMIKLTARRNELTQKRQQVQMQLQECVKQDAYLAGALDDLNYQMLTWGNDRVGKGTSFEITARIPEVQQLLQENQQLKTPAEVVQYDPETGGFKGMPDGIAVFDADPPGFEST